MKNAKGLEGVGRVQIGGRVFLNSIMNEKIWRNRSGGLVPAWRKCTRPNPREAMQVRDIMTRDPITLPPAAFFINALRIMSSHDTESIPIVQDDKIVGIVTRMDILKVTELKKL